jgi:hypothetical protein
MPPFAGAAHSHRLKLPRPPKIPRNFLWRIADEIGLKIMREVAPARGGAVHELARVGEPRRPHDHRLTALPVDFAFLYAFVFEVFEQAAREQRDEDGRETVPFLVLEAVVAGDVALRGRKEDDAKDSAVYGRNTRGPIDFLRHAKCVR